MSVCMLVNSVHLCRIANRARHAPVQSPNVILRPARSLLRSASERGFGAESATPERVPPNATELPCGAPPQRGRAPWSGAPYTIFCDLSEG